MLGNRNFNTQTKLGRTRIMEVYIYQADLYCLTCGLVISQELSLAGKQPDTLDNESTYDSDDFPKGPYPDGGGDADTPQHCGKCGVFLENPLTTEGVDYVSEACSLHQQHGASIELWAEFYKDQLQ